MGDNFDESFDGEGFNIVFVDDNKLQRKMFIDRKSTRLNSSHLRLSRMPSSA